MPAFGLLGHENQLFQNSRYDVLGERTRLETANRPLENIYQVHEGCLAIVVNLPCGRVHCPEIYTPGDIAPVIGLLPKRVGVELTAISSVRVRRVARQTALELLQTGAASKDWVFDLLESKAYWGEVRSIVTNFGDAAEKLAAVLAELWLRVKGAYSVVPPSSVFPLPVRQSHLSLLSGLSKAQVSRVFAMWTGSNMIQMTNDTLVILEPDFLVRAIDGLKGLVPCQR